MDAIWLIVGLLSGTMAYAIAEEIILTTYYPSPRGVYNELRTLGDVKIGDISASAPQGRLEIRGRTPIMTDKALYVGNSEGTARFVVQDDGNVGIGTGSPQNTLDVEGRAVIGAAYSGTNTAPANGLLVEGNVGIGTPTPGVKLDVAGMVRGTDLDCPDCLTATDIAADAVGSSEVADGSLTAADLAANSVGNEELFDGGTWTLTSPLTIQGNLQVTGTISGDRVLNPTYAE